MTPTDPNQSTSLSRTLTVALAQPRVRRRLVVCLIGLVFLATAAVTYARYARDRASGGGSNERFSFNLGSRKLTSSDRAIAALDGTSVPADHANRRPLAVMVENHPDARPQSGLSRASVVIEAITEGGITRFAALYGPTDAEKIGPVRSARPYFVEYVSGWQALYAHAGGSQGGLTLIPRAPIVDLPHNQSAFYREPRPGIASEHTLFTSSDRLYEYAKQKKASLTDDYQPWTFADDPDTSARGTSQHATIDFSSPAYKVDWSYDQSTDQYLRMLAGAPHTDAVTSQQLDAETVVLLTVTRHNDPNANQGKGEWTYDTIGAGPAKLLVHGRLVEGTWKKPALGAMLEFIGGDGKTVPLGRGRTWIEIVPPDVSVTIE
jgi:hypothetical protein